MGSSMSAKVLFIGLDGSGKTSLLTYLKQGPNDVAPKPSVGFDTKELKYKGVNMSIFDVAGAAKVRELWKHYYPDMDAVVWLIDASDPARFPESKQALSTALKDASMSRDCPILVAANKCDAPGAKTEDEIKQALDLDTLLKGRVWAIKRTNSKQGDGISDSFKWLSSEIKADFKRKRK
eukprot:TRINITY_DN10893_c0_g1_i1.p1 TRINITY_DN10893_c0_g1~~TRINITY_DN10893_c0_g1_i1.p1  ORF type:complete len:179 (-),score=29.58 TRINITY_DN10893_c0_g1_i1:190-726(-)